MAILEESGSDMMNSSGVSVVFLLRENKQQEKDEKIFCVKEMRWVAS